MVSSTGICHREHIRWRIWTCCSFCGLWPQVLLEVHVLGASPTFKDTLFFPPIDINTSPLPLLIWCLTKKLAIWSNIEGSHLNACQSPTQGLSMGFSTIILNTHGVHLTADFGTWTQMRCDCTMLTSHYPPTLVGPWLASPFLSLLQWTNPHWAPRGTKGYWLTGFPATL